MGFHEYLIGVSSHYMLLIIAVEPSFDVLRDDLHGKSLSCNSADIIRGDAIFPDQLQSDSQSSREFVKTCMLYLLLFFLLGLLIVLG